MNKYLLAYNHMTLKHKLVIAFALVSFIPLIFVGVFLTNQMKSMALQQSITEAETQVDRIVNDMEETMVFNDTLQSAIIADSEMYQVINQTYTSNLEIFEAYYAYGKIGEYEEIYTQVEDIRLYIDNETMLNNMDFMKLETSNTVEKWYQGAYLHDYKSYSGYYYDSIKKEPFVVLSRIFTYNKDQTDVIMSLIPISEFNHMVTYLEHDYMILDSEGIIIGSKSSSQIGESYEGIYGLDIRNKEDFFQEEVDGEAVQFITRKVNLSRLGNTSYVVAAIPVEVILDGANKASSLGFSIIAGSLVLATVFVFLLSTLLSKRIKVLEQNMNRVSKGDFDHIEILEGRDEIGQLSNHLNQMVQSLQTLMSENDLMHEKEKALILSGEQTRFELLASQINPHFLFNVLESIRMKAHTEGNHEISQTVQLLGKVMRRSLEMTNDTITLAEELEFIEAYIQIQTFRFSERFTYTTDIEAGLSSVEILPLLLQPIVENAVVYGMEGLESSGEITLKAYAKGSSLMIEIEDNGIGITEERLSQIEAIILAEQVTDTQLVKTDTKRKRKHIGIKNVNDRIKLKYGSTYGVDIESEVGNGTIVTIILPYEDSNKEGENNGL